MEGNERKMNGDERKMEGNERKMEGNERKMKGNERKLPDMKGKYMFSYEFLHGPTSKLTFRARLPSIFITCHKMPRVRRNLHLGTTLRSADNAICKKTRNMKLRDDGNLLRLPHKIDVDTLKKHDLEPLRAAVTRRLAS